MKGYIITYNTISAKEMTDLNNNFIGRVVRVKRGNTIFHYYYSGLLDNISYIKLSNGCYFIGNQYCGRELITNLNHITIWDAELEVKPDELYTAREYFRKKYNNIRVANLD